MDEFVEITNELGERVGVARNTETTDDTGHSRVRVIPGGGLSTSPISESDFTQEIEDAARAARERVPRSGVDPAVVQAVDPEQA